mgnify:CR=1 FL=1
MKDILAGVRVLDFGRYIAGPYCAALLAEFGADVIRIEKREGSEDRFQLPMNEFEECGAAYMQVNRNKRGMTLNPLKPEAGEIIKRLVATTDVVVANLPTKTLAAMQIDYESLKAVKPDIILTRVTAYGDGGPYSDRVGFDAVGQVMCGTAYMTAEGEGERPFRHYTPWVDFGTALHCAYGTALALLGRESTGRGQVVEGTLLGTALTMSNALLIEQSVLGKDKKPYRQPCGNRSNYGAPGDIFKTRDGWVMAMALGQPLYQRWAKLMGEDHWLTDPRFKDDVSRAKNSKVISERMSSWCGGRSSAEVVDILGKAMIPAAPVLSPQQTLDDPHVQAVGFMQPVDYPGLPRKAPVAKVAVALSDSPGSIRQRPPTLGEHTNEIMGEIGFSADEIQSFRDNSII